MSAPSASIRPLPKHPTLFQVSARIITFELGHVLKRKATLEDIPDEYLDRISALGFDIFYLLGVWSTGQRSLEEARKHMKKISPQTPQDHVCSSPFSVTGYDVHSDFGGNEALKTLRMRLGKRGMRLLVDFIPNHIAHDHPWVQDSPHFIFPGNDHLLHTQPQNFFKGHHGKIFAHGKDPYFDGWQDTCQLNYAEEALRRQQTEVLEKISTMADGVRCDMAMLVTTDIFRKTWGGLYHQATGRDLGHFEEFWPKAIKSVKSKNPEFIFMAEVYWDMEFHLQKQGFDYCYDKRLFDRLKLREGNEARMHLHADLGYQSKLVRFLENHDEDRSADTFKHINEHRAAAVACFTSPGCRFFYDGQLEGRKFHLEMQRVVRPPEAPNPEASGLYMSILDILRRPAIRNGDWIKAEVYAGGEGNDSWHNVIAHFWAPPLPLKAVPETTATTELTDESGRPIIDPAGFRGVYYACPLLCVSNFSGHEAVCHVKFPGQVTDKLPSYLATVPPHKTRDQPEVLLHGLLGIENYGRRIGEAQHKGVWFKLHPWQANVFALYAV
ncbi:unnamed protein product [Vitrella brassicaformis CCMP3155]|uniref:Glycosyl hydrolase family 13 catalytic domain-containing protein n=2 Tax=Vitrella brassicaformis TaxID=1169539 RepID=A0A0G4FGJ4_VITBC|nr:unnamed protein product [Vitrella brassicaformis CCMP3155]|eukprot:CEM12471.1 unnamed protein product [Vitrella brassicaformis CCMP3155]